MRKVFVILMCAALAACGGGGCDAGEPAFGTAKDKADWHAECDYVPPAAPAASAPK